MMMMMMIMMGVMSRPAGGAPGYTEHRHSKNMEKI